MIVVGTLPLPGFSDQGGSADRQVPIAIPSKKLRQAWRGTRDFQNVHFFECNQLIRKIASGCERIASPDRRRPVVWFLPLSLPIPSSGGVNGHKQSASDNFNSLTPTLFLSRPQSSHLLPDQSPLLLGCQGIRRCNIFWCPVASVSRYLLFVPFYSPRSPGRRPHKVTRVGPPWILAKRSGPM